MQDSPPTAAVTDAERLMRSVLQRIATGPELSKPIAEQEARAAMRAILEGAIDPVQAAVFLIALRMKRETDEENLGVLAGILDRCHTATAPVEALAVLTDPYDGCNRMLPAAPFLAPLLAACGLPTLTHGVDCVGPKCGLTHRLVLRAAGQPVELSVDAAAARLADPGIGWSYIDQAAYCPPLHALIPLRNLIVKRSLINTVEVCLSPILARGATHLVTGYVHKNYPRLYALLARRAGFASALIVRGLEGGVVPSLEKRGRFFGYRDGGELEALEIEPEMLGIAVADRAPPRPSSGPDGSIDLERSAERAADAGLAALGGQAGPTREGLVMSASAVLWHLGRAASPRAAADRVRATLDSGAALAHLQGGG